MAGATTVGVVGLGYVGLPLAVEFGKKYPTVGFDLSASQGRGVWQGQSIRPAR